MSATEKADVISKVEASPGSRRKIMAESAIPKSTYYRWRTRQRQGKLEDSPHSDGSWNTLTPDEKSVVLDVANEYTDRSSRQLAAWITDNKGFSVSESKVDPIIKTARGLN